MDKKVLANKILINFLKDNPSESLNTLLTNKYHIVNAFSWYESNEGSNFWLRVYRTTKLSDPQFFNDFLKKNLSKTNVFIDFIHYINYDRL